MKSKSSQIFVLFILAFLFSIKPYAQNWFPLEVGNKWQYLTESGYSIAFGEPWIYQYYLTVYSISGDTLINQTSYFKWSGDNWYRFDNSKQKLFLWCNYADSVRMDFIAPVGSSQLLSTFSCYNKLMEIIDDTLYFGDSLIYSKGYWDSYYGLGEYHLQDFYSIDLGLTKQLSWANYHGGGGSYQELTLIQANIGNNHYSHNYSPGINIQPILVVDDSLFDLTLSVFHEYNHIFPDTTPHQSLNFIDTVKMYSFYSKGSTVIQNPTFYASSILGTEHWELEIFLDMNLMMNDYKFNYKMEAVDKSMLPHISFAPDTGYFIAVYDTTSDVIIFNEFPNSFELFQNYPNPFNPLTKIKYSIPQTDNPLQGGATRLGEGRAGAGGGGLITLKVYDVLGNEVATLVNEEKLAGTYEAEFVAEGLPSGVYFYQLRAGSYIETKKMLLLK